ncbi:MAG: Gfo/Idh/MocA family protein [Acidimicrobiales bacterium]
MGIVRWGILSTAKIGTAQVIPAIQAAENSEVVAIASRDSVRAESVAAELGIARSHSSYQALLDDPDVDAVYIPLPNHLHAKWTLKAASAGKHVLCEKPLAMNASEAKAMVDGCEAAGVLLMEAFMYRLHPAWVRTRHLIAQGHIGELRTVQSFFSYFNRDPHNIRNVLEMGGGAVMDIGCYSINLSRMLFGSEPVAVSASVQRDPEFGVDVLTSALLEFAGGGQATFTCGTQLQRHQDALIVGSDGRIEIAVPFTPDPRRESSIVVASARQPADPGASEVITFPAVNQYTIQAELFADAILSGKPVPTPPADAVANMAVIGEILSLG